MADKKRVDVALVERGLAASREKAQALVARMFEGDREAANRLIEHNLRLVVYIARRFENTKLNIEDLISIGTIGLIKAINTFNSSKKIKLATYASRCIENEILMYLRKLSAQKTEVSFDEPLNTDWDGNELLLSDILGTEPDLVSKDLDADMLGISQSYISRLEKRIIERLRKEMTRLLQV